jgi:LysM repeat protein
MKSIIVLSFFIFLAASIFAQEPKTKPKTEAKPKTDTKAKEELKTTEKKATKSFSPDSLFIVVNGDARFIQHRVKKGETVYSITKYYNIETSLLNRHNPSIEKAALAEKQILTIPLHPKALIRSKAKGFKDSSHFKVFYKVLPKETMYGIATGYFGLTVESLQERNKLKTTDLKVSQVLHIGWLPKSGIPDSLNKVPWLTVPLAEENKKLKKKYESAIEKGAVEIKQEGKACWPKDKQMESGNSLYILHSKAKIGSIVRIENPMTERIIYARVAGPLPDTDFARGSIAMIPTTLANLLGVLDSTVFLKIQYSEKK